MRNYVPLYFFKGGIKKDHINYYISAEKLKENTGYDYDN